MNTIPQVPFYLKMAFVFVSLFSIIFILYIGQDILIPIVYATLLAIILNPFVNFLIRKRFHKIIAISMVVLLTIIIGIGIIYIISTQISMSSDTYQQLEDKFYKTKIELLEWISDTFEIRKSNINLWINETQKKAIDNFAVGDNLNAASGIIMTFFLLPVYLFLILYYKTLLLEFTYQLFQKEHHNTISDILTNTKKIIQTYLFGLFFELILVAIMNSVGLLLLGIEYAIIIGIIGAILNIIPYLGGIVSTAIPMIVAFITKDSLSYPIIIFFMYIFIQFIDNNYLIPKVVASKVQLNALISVIVVLIGGSIWGLSGMFLSIPLTAVLKVIFDHIEPLKPWGFLLGNTVTTRQKFIFIKRTTHSN